MVAPGRLRAVNALQSFCAIASVGVNNANAAHSRTECMNVQVISSSSHFPTNSSRHLLVAIENWSEVTLPLV
jgi:hypothetical protein